MDEGWTRLLVAGGFIGGSIGILSALVTTRAGEGRDLFRRRLSGQFHKRYLTPRDVPSALVSYVRLQQRVSAMGLGVSGVVLAALPLDASTGRARFIWWVAILACLAVLASAAQAIAAASRSARTRKVATRDLVTPWLRWSAWTMVGLSALALVLGAAAGGDLALAEACAAGGACLGLLAGIVAIEFSGWGKTAESDVSMSSDSRYWRDALHALAATQAYMQIQIGALVLSMAGLATLFWPGSPAHAFELSPSLWRLTLAAIVGISLVSVAVEWRAAPRFRSRLWPTLDSSEIVSTSATDAIG